MINLTNLECSFPPVLLHLRPLASICFPPPVARSLASRSLSHTIPVAPRLDSLSHDLAQAPDFALARHSDHPPWTHCDQANSDIESTAWVFRQTLLGGVS